DRLIEVCDRLVVILLGVPDEAPITVGHGKARTQFNRFSVIGERLFVLSLLGIGFAPIAVGRGISGVEPDRFGVVGHCLAVLLVLWLLGQQSVLIIKQVR